MSYDKSPVLDKETIKHLHPRDLFVLIHGIKSPSKENAPILIDRYISLVAAQKDRELESVLDEIDRRSSGWYTVEQVAAQKAHAMRDEREWRARVGDSTQRLPVIESFIGNCDEYLREAAYRNFQSDEVENVRASLTSWKRMEELLK